MNTIPTRLHAGDVRRPTPVRVLGGDARLASNDEPELFTEEQLLAADRQRNVNKPARDDHAALEQQVHMLRCMGGL